MANKISIKTHLKQQSTTIHLKPLSDHQSVRKSLPEEKGLCLLAKGQQRWSQPGLQWEGVPKSGSSNREVSPHVSPRNICWGSGTKTKASPGDLKAQAG